MIQANELRIGNFILIDGKLIELTKQKFKVGVITLNCIGLNPIPITEEWLVRFGFVKYDQMGDYSFWNYSLPNQRGWNIAVFHDGVYVSFWSLNWDNCPIIQHVHQLQNLYFALTGQELKLNDK